MVEIQSFKNHYTRPNQVKCLINKPHLTQLGLACGLAGTRRVGWIQIGPGSGRLRVLDLEPETAASWGRFLDLGPETDPNTTLAPGMNPADLYKDIADKIIKSNQTAAYPLHWIFILGRIPYPEIADNRYYFNTIFSIRISVDIYQYNSCLIIYIWIIIHFLYSLLIII